MAQTKNHFTWGFTQETQFTNHLIRRFTQVAQTKNHLIRRFTKKAQTKNHLIWRFTLEAQFKNYLIRRPTKKAQTKNHLIWRFTQEAQFKNHIIWRLQPFVGRKARPTNNTKVILVFVVPCKLSIFVNQVSGDSFVVSIRHNNCSEIIIEHYSETLDRQKIYRI